jgi:hypothetical protein
MSGTVLIEAKGVNYPLETGDMLVVNPGIVHEVKPSSTERDISNISDTARRTLSPTRTTSGPIPSPGRMVILNVRLLFEKADIYKRNKNLAGLREITALCHEYSYHARDLATVRAKQDEATLLLGTATPSLESFHNAEKGKFHLLSLLLLCAGLALGIGDREQVVIEALVGEAF